MYKLKIENGCYIFKLDDMLKQKDISINQLMKDTNTDFKVIKRIMTGNLVKFQAKFYNSTRYCFYSYLGLP